MSGGGKPREEGELINSVFAVQMNIYLTLLLVSIAIHACLKLERRERGNPLFLVLLLLTLLILVLETFSVFFAAPEYQRVGGLQKIIEVLGFALAPLLPFCISLYSQQRVFRYDSSQNRKWSRLSLPLLLNLVIATVSYFLSPAGTDVAYGEVRSNLLASFSYLTTGFYYFVNLLVIYVGRWKVTREEVVVLGLLSGIPLLFSLFQLSHFIWSGVTIALVINYVYIVHNQAKRDPLTGLANRMAYEEYLASFRRRTGRSLAAINIDLDDFKRINDSFGHHEGDHALQLFARELSATFAGKGLAVRLGGDEFLVLLEEERQEVLQQYVANLKERIESRIKECQLPYAIHFSYGLTTLDEGYRSVREMVEHSDALMYEKKQGKAGRARKRPF
ncbi:GGDEF domain-containing protein [Anaeromusa acidaminophila]|uniref:GGDEF domain-containing protein n=1 Tax=Anaeromusa acidaminophila TaxID=81464 RepID=UPI000366C841|nr:GGDEF domain-containing protein [Anaeromusa acidaminophila]